MKLKVIILGLLVTASLILLGNSRVLAEEIKVDRDVINAEILSDGAITVTEEITFNISGKYNGVFKDISNDKAGNISIISVDEIKDTALNYTKVNSANNGDKGVYTLQTSGTNTRVKIYSPSNNVKKAFRIQYKIEGAAKKYRDIGEFYWKFIGKENETGIRNLEINLILPAGSKRDDIRAFGHGPLEGSWRIIDDRTVRFTVANLSSGKYVEVRTLFPQSLLSAAQIRDNENKLQQILEDEEKYSQKKIASDKHFQNILILLRYIAGIISIFNVLLIPYLLVKFRKQEEMWQTSSRNIQDYDPTILAYLANRYLYNHNLLAAILELARKGYLSIEPMEDWVAKNKFQKEKYQNYRIIKLRDADEKLLEHEKYLIRWLIDIIGDGNSVVLSQIKSYGESRPTDFRRQFALWRNEVKRQVEMSNLIDRNADTTRGIIVILEVLLMIISVVFIVLTQLYGVISLVFSLAAFITALFINVRTVEGNYQYSLWKEMHHKLKTFGQSEIELWAQNTSLLELSTIYAVSMGLRDRMVLKLQPYMTSANHNAFFNLMFFHSILRDRKDDGFYGAFGSSFSGTGYSGGGFSSGDGGGGGGSSGGGGGAGGF